MGWPILGGLKRYCLNRRRGLSVAALAGVLTLGFGAQAAADDITTEWMDEILRELNATHPEPTASARAVAVVMTAMYDTWAAYDETAVGIVTGNVLDGTGGPATESNIREAMSHAAFNAMYSMTRVRNPFIQKMDELFLDWQSDSRPAILGRRIAATVLAHRRKDGSNQIYFYADTTNYMSADPSELERWQPEIIDDMLQEPVTPHWGRVIPFGLQRADQFRPPVPPAVDSPEFMEELDAVLEYSRTLDTRGKAIAEYWLPQEGTPATHLMHLTQEVIEREDLPLAEEIKLYMVVANALLDAGIATWEAKYHYDYVRPITAINRLGDREIVAWDRDRDDIRPMKARDWDSYLETPAFPEYTSGHSAFTAAWARAMELMMGDVEFDYTAKVYQLEEAGELHSINPIEIPYPTYWSAAEGSGISRLHGGVHWPIGNTEGLALGRKTAELSVAKAKRYIEGKAMPSTAAFGYLKEPMWEYGSDGAMTSVMLDPVPAGRYALSIAFESDDTGARRRSRIEIMDPQGRPLGLHDESGRTESDLPAWVSASWVSDGRTPFYVIIGPARADVLAARESGKPMDAPKIDQIFHTRAN